MIIILIYSVVNNNTHKNTNNNTNTNRKGKEYLYHHLCYGYSEFVMIYHSILNKVGSDRRYGSDLCYGYGEFVMISRRRRRRSTSLNVLILVCLYIVIVNV